MTIDIKWAKDFFKRHLSANQVEIYLFECNVNVIFRSTQLFNM